MLDKIERRKKSYANLNEQEDYEEENTYDNASVKFQELKQRS